MNKYIRKDLLNFKPYHAPLKPYEIKLDANENPYPHYEALAQHMLEWLKDKDNLTRYPDTDCHKLREAIGKRYEVSKENIVCGVGSDQLIEFIIKVFLEPNDCVIVPTPSFSMYALSTYLNHGRVVEVSLDVDFNYDIDVFVQTIQTEKPKLIFLCTPNNPTGCLLSKKSIRKILSVADCPVVIDEAYAEFTAETMVNEIETYPNMIVLRTFSKAFGLAGLRTGYGIACKEMIETISLAKSPYNLSSYSQEASLFVLEHYDYYMELVQKLNKERQRVFDELLAIKYIERVYESNANFILIRVSKTHIAQMLDSHKILVRDYPPVGALAHCIRLTIGTEEENKQILKILKEADYE